jgi:hypothetical protein
METKANDVSPRTLSKAAGWLYLMVIVLGLFGEMGVRGKIVVSGDAAATAANMRAMESLWHLGNAAEFVLAGCAIALVPLLYMLLRPVSPLLAFMAISFDLVSLAVQASSALNLVVARFPLGSAGYLSAFDADQLNAMTSLSIKAHAYGYGVALIFFGCFCIIAGYLIFKSGYLPRAIGVLMQVAGVCYLINSFALIAAPTIAARLFPAILLPSFVGEASLCAWLLVKGVNEEKWKLRPT